MMDTRTHSEFAPSSMARLEQCPASWRLSRDFQSVGSEDADRGTRLHAEIASCIADGKPARSEEVGKCLAWFKSIVRDGDDIQTERRVAYVDFTGKELYYGTSDIVIIRADGSAIVVDWKFGNAFVPARDNIQIGAYACALFQEENKSGINIKRIDGFIFQPSVSDEPAVWEDIPLQEEAARITEVIGMCNSRDPDIHAGEHCRYCPAGQNGACPLCTSRVASLSQALARNVQPLSVQSVATATDETLANWMEALEMADVFSRAVKEEFSRRLEGAGKDGLCGWKLQRARGALRVKDPVQLLLDIQETVKVTPSDFISAGSFSPKKVADLLKGMAPDKEKAKEYDAIAQELCEKWGERGTETVRIVKAKK